MHVPANTTVSFSMQQIEDQILYYVQYFSLLNFLCTTQGRRHWYGQYGHGRTGFQGGEMKKGATGIQTWPRG